MSVRFSLAIVDNDTFPPEILDWTLKLQSWPAEMEKHDTQFTQELLSLLLSLEWNICSAKRVGEFVLQLNKNAVIDFI